MKKMIGITLLSAVAVGSAKGGLLDCGRSFEGSESRGECAGGNLGADEEIGIAGHGKKDAAGGGGGEEFRNSEMKGKGLVGGFDHGHFRHAFPVGTLADPGQIEPFTMDAMFDYDGGVVNNLLSGTEQQANSERLLAADEAVANAAEFGAKTAEGQQALFSKG